MKVGLITFHWAANYGAVLQTYALQQYIRQMGHEAEVIDYTPQWASDNRPIPFPRSIGSCIDYIDLLYKRAVFARFRKEHLYISKKRYVSLADLNNAAQDYDLILTGSDQVFNPDIIASGGSLDLAYLLGFPKLGTKKAAYAASFGNSFLAEQHHPAFRKALEEFDAIGIREKTGIDVISKLTDTRATWTPDPTLLLANFDLLKSEKRSAEGKYIFKLLFQNSPDALRCVDKAAGFFPGAAIKELTNLKTRIRNPRIHGINHPSPQQWIETIRNAEFIVTDSFHCTVFCLLTHRPFISLSLNSWGTDWSERIRSLLTRVGLPERLLADNDEQHIANLTQTPIDWDAVDENIAQWRTVGRDFLSSLTNR